MELGVEFWRRHGACCAFRAFSCFSVDRELDLVRELFLALSRRAHNNKHAVPF